MNNARNLLCTLITMVLLLAGCTPAAHLQGGILMPPDSSYSKAFQPNPCWFAIPSGATVTCGYVSVSEDYSQTLTPENTIDLAVAIFHSHSAHPAADPIVYHIGGPGGHMLGIAPTIYEKVIAPFLQTRDLVFFDPRGTGYSQPSLECQKEEDPGDCLRRLFTEGHNLYVYNSVNLAKDLQGLRTALGYDTWNLLGESYGTHVAQVAMREAPEGLRSVILDSVMPVDIPDIPGGKNSFQAALERLIKACANDPACNDSYPDLKGALKRAMHRLDQNPVHLQANCFGQEKSTVLTGDRLASMLFNALYETENMGEIPNAIISAANGSSYAFWTNVICWEVMIDDLLLSSGPHWAMLCGDGKLGELCEDWPVAVEQSPVRSDIPTLVLSGEFDPITPLEYGHSVAQFLSKSYSIDFPGFGHWINGTGHPCQVAILQAFLADPSQIPDSRCLEGLENSIFTR